MIDITGAVIALIRSIIALIRAVIALKRFINHHLKDISPEMKIKCFITNRIFNLSQQKISLKGTFYIVLTTNVAEKYNNLNLSQENLKQL